MLASRAVRRVTVAGDWRQRGAGTRVNHDGRVVGTREARGEVSGAVCGWRPLEPDILLRGTPTEVGAGAKCIGHSRKGRHGGGGGVESATNASDQRRR